MQHRKFFVSMTHTDAAGVLFHGRAFDIADVVGEQMFAEMGFFFRDLFDPNVDFTLRVVSCEASFCKPVFVSDWLDVEVTCEKIGKTSFTLLSNFKKKGELAFSTRIKNVCVHKKNKCSVDVPPLIISVLERI